MGACSGITTTDILAVADDSGYEALEWLHLCREMDGVYMRYVQSQKKNEHRNPRPKN